MVQESAPSHDSLPIDCDELLGRCMGNLMLMRRLLGNFLEQIGNDLEALFIAMQRQDASEVARLAHKVRGTSLSVSALGLARAAQLLESSLATVEIVELPEIAANLTREQLRICDFLNSHCTVEKNA